MLQERVFSYLSLDSILTNGSNGRAEPNPLVCVKKQFFKDAMCCFLLFKEKVRRLVWSSLFSNGDALSELKGLLLYIGAKSMVDVKAF